MDHDIRVWLTAEQYLGAVHAAEADDRTLSSYVRGLIRQDLVTRALAVAWERASAEPGRVQDAEGRYGR